MMWSRTVTEKLTSALQSMRVAQLRPAGAVGEGRHRRGQSARRRRRRAARRRPGPRAAAARAPAARRVRAPAALDAATSPTWLEPERQAPRVEVGAEVERLPDGCRTSSRRHLAVRGRRSRASAGPPPSRWPRSRYRGRSRRVPARRSRRPAGAPPAPWRDRRRRAVTSTPGMPAASRAMQQPIMPAPMTVMRSPSGGAASHSTLTAVSTAPASTARRAGTPSGTRHDRVGRDDEGRLVREQGEHGAAAISGCGPRSTTPTLR